MEKANEITDAQVSYILKVLKEVWEREHPGYELEWKRRTPSTTTEAG